MLVGLPALAQRLDPYGMQIEVRLNGGGLCATTLRRWECIALTLSDRSLGKGGQFTAESESLSAILDSKRHGPFLLTILEMATGVLAAISASSTHL